jgi:hypothetical protein
VTRLSFPRYALLVLILALFLPVSARAQNVMEGTPYSPVFEVSPRGRPDMIITKLRLDQVYDTNLISEPTGQLSGTYSSLLADVIYVHQRPGSILMITYEGGGDLYPQSQYSNLDAASNLVRGTLRQSLTKRMNMNISADYGSLPGSAFESASGEEGQQQGSGDENTEFLARRHDSTDASLSMQYQTSPHTYLAWGGNYNNISYQPAAEFSDSRSENAYGAYYYQYTAAQNVSIGYSNQWIDFPGHDVHSVVRNILFTYSNALTPKLSVSGYVGPAFVSQVSETSQGSSQTAQSNQSNIVGGGQLKWDNIHTDIIVRYDRMYSRGSGLVGTSLRQISSLSISQRFTQHLVLSMHVNYTTNDLSLLDEQGDTSWRVQPTVRYHFRSGLWLTASEGYVRADRLSTAGTLDRSITTFGVEIDLPNYVLEK